MDQEVAEEDIKEEDKEVVINKEEVIMIITEEGEETMKTEITNPETKAMIIMGKKFRIMMMNTNKNIKKKDKSSTFQSSLNLNISQSSLRMMLLCKIKMIRMNRGKREDTQIKEEVEVEEAEAETGLLNTTMKAKIIIRILIKRSHTMIARDSQRATIIINKLKVATRRKLSSKSLTDKFSTKIRNIKLQRSKQSNNHKRKQPPRRSQKQQSNNQLQRRKSSQRSKTVTDSQSSWNEHNEYSLFINHYIFYHAYPTVYRI